MTTGYFYHDDCTLHEMGPWHPESPQRLEAIDRHLRDTGLHDELTLITPSLAPRAALERVHPLNFLTMLDQVSPVEGKADLDGDTSLNPHSLRAAGLAAGAIVEATRKVLTGELDNAFCAVRPPGHHAERAIAMGFCIFNNVAVGVAEALDTTGIERVAVLDFDVHHGNGTVDIFQDDERVLVCSSFQHPFYPMRHFDLERPNIVNTPVPADTGSDEFRRRIEQDWLARVQSHRPQMIFVSAGFDAHQEDPLGGLQLQDEDYRWITTLIVDLARTSAEGRIVATLEGGYDLDALARSVAEHIAVLHEAA